MFKLSYHWLALLLAGIAPSTSTGSDRQPAPLEWAVEQDEDQAEDDRAADQWEYARKVVAAGTQSERVTGVLLRNGSPVLGQLGQVVDTPKGRFMYFGKQDGAYAKGWLNKTASNTPVFNPDGSLAAKGVEFRKSLREAVKLKLRKPAGEAPALLREVDEWVKREGMRFDGGEAVSCLSFGKNEVVTKVATRFKDESRNKSYPAENHVLHAWSSVLLVGEQYFTYQLDTDNKVLLLTGLTTFIPQGTWRPDIYKPGDDRVPASESEPDKDAGAETPGENLPRREPSAATVADRAEQNSEIRPKVPTKSGGQHNRPFVIEELVITCRPKVRIINIPVFGGLNSRIPDPIRPDAVVLKKVDLAELHLDDGKHKISLIRSDVDQWKTFFDRDKDYVFVLGRFRPRSQPAHRWRDSWQHIKTIELDGKVVYEDPNFESMKKALIDDNSKARGAEVDKPGIDQQPDKESRADNDAEAANPGLDARRQEKSVATKTAQAIRRALEKWKDQDNLPVMPEFMRRLGQPWSSQNEQGRLEVAFGDTVFEVRDGVAIHGKPYYVHSAGWYIKIVQKKDGMWVVDTCELRGEPSNE